MGLAPTPGAPKGPVSRGHRTRMNSAGTGRSPGMNVEMIMALQLTGGQASLPAPVPRAQGEAVGLPADPSRAEPS